MAKKLTSFEENNRNTLELSENEAAQFDSEIRAKLEKNKAPKPVTIKALSRELLRRGPYAVVDRNKIIFKYPSRREAYDKAIEINTERGFVVHSIVEEI